MYGIPPKREGQYCVSPRQALPRYEKKESDEDDLNENGPSPTI